MARIAEVPLDFANMATLDNGKVNKLLKFHLQRVAQDLIARPGDGTQRKITLELGIKPIADADGEIDGCEVEIEAKSKIPTYRTKKYQMRVANNGLLFNQDFPDSLDQQSLLPNEEA